MRFIVGIIIGALAAGLYFNPEGTKQAISDGADWVKELVSEESPKEIVVKIPKIVVDN